MKLQTNNFGFESHLPQNRMGAKIKTSAKLFDILSSGIYADPVLAPIRELSCNAWDSHMFAGYPERPFHIFVPSWLEPTFYVEDFGTGIPPEKFSDIFYTYGNSTKTDDEHAIGALGLGSKSPFAYTKSSFAVRNRYEGKEYMYMCFINEVGEPDGSLISTTDTTEPNGLKVEFAVKTSDIFTFRERITRFFRYWQGTMPVFLNCDDDELKIKNVSKILEGDGWYLDGSERTQPLAMMGNVPYRVDAASIQKMPIDLAVLAKNSFVINFQMGSLNFAASREGLKYDETTCEVLIKRFEEVKNDIIKTFLDKLNAAKTQVEFIELFGRTFTEFRNIVSPNSGRMDDSSTELYLNMLLGKGPRDTIVFDGYTYALNDLVNLSFELKSSKHQAFGLISAATRSNKSSKVWLNTHSMIKYTAAEQLEKDFFAPIAKNTDHEHDTSVVEGASKGESFTFTWRDQAPRTRKPSKVDLLMSNYELFNITTTHNVKFKLNCTDLTFVINDVGSSGGTRFKLINNQMMFLADFNPKYTTVKEVQTELAELIAKNGIKGAKIVLLSSLPDHRTHIEKAKPETGTLKLRHLELSVINNRTCYFHVDTVSVELKGSTGLRTAGAKPIETIHKLSDLQAAKMVLYVIKRRSPTQFYDNTTSSKNSIVTQDTLIDLSYRNGFFDDVVENSKVKIFTLNEGQVEWLKKRDVKVVNLAAHITASIKAMHDADKFTDRLTEMLGIRNIEIVSSMYALMKKDVKNLPAQSLYAQSLAKYDEAVAAKSKLDTDLGKLFILKMMVGGYDNLGFKYTREQEVKILKTYPLLKFLRLDQESLKEVRAYLDEIDQKIV